MPWRAEAGGLTRRRHRTCSTQTAPGGVYCCVGLRFGHTAIWPHIACLPSCHACLYSYLSVSVLMFVCLKRTGLLKTGTDSQRPHGPETRPAHAQTLGGGQFDEKTAQVEAGLIDGGRHTGVCPARVVVWRARALRRESGPTHAALLPGPTRAPASYSVPHPVCGGLRPVGITA